MKFKLLFLIIFFCYNGIAQVVTNELQIVGSNIWVRSEPTTGDVVMKLNDGDDCRILEKGHFEYIRKIPHYWYKIIFQADTGWVFGSQTNLASNIDVLSAREKPELLEIFKNSQILKCISECEEADGKCIVNGFNYLPKTKVDNLLNLHYEHEGPSSLQYTVDTEFQNQLFMINVMIAMEGAAGISNSDNFYLGFLNESVYTMPDMAFEGKAVDLIEKNENEYFLVSFKETRNVLMYYSSHYNIYLVNKKTQTVQLILGKIGKSLGGGMMEQNEEGFSYRYKSDIDFNSSTLGFNLSCFNKIKTSDGWFADPKPEISNYLWDKKHRRFITP